MPGDLMLARGQFEEALRLYGMNDMEKQNLYGGFLISRSAWNRSRES